MRILFLAFLLTAFGACTNPLQENYRQLDINLDESIRYKKEQTTQLVSTKENPALDSIADAFGKVENSIGEVNKALFDEADPDIFLLEERNSLTELETLGDEKREALRRSLLNYSNRLNELVGEEVCTFGRDSMFFESKFETYFTEQQKPALLIFVKKIELDCWQCRFMAAFEEVSDTQDKKTN